jgi:hypothetical protein
LAATNRRVRTGLVDQDLPLAARAGLVGVLRTRLEQLASPTGMVDAFLTDRCAKRFGHTELSCTLWDGYCDWAEERELPLAAALSRLAFHRELARAATK